VTAIFTAEVSRRIGKRIAQTLGITARFTRQAAKTIAVAVASDASLVARKCYLVFLQAIDVTTTLAVGLSRGIGKSITATVRLAARIFRWIKGKGWPLERSDGWCEGEHKGWPVQVAASWRIRRTHKRWTQSKGTQQWPPWEDE
jgi:hypothetical protein